MLRVLCMALMTLLLAGNMAMAEASADAKSFFTSAEGKFAQGDFKGAIADYTKVIELDPKNADAFNSRGEAKFDSGDKQGAIADYTRTIELDPKYADAYNNRGSAKSEFGDKQGALARSSLA